MGTDLSPCKAEVTLLVTDPEESQSIDKGMLGGFSTKRRESAMFI